VSLKNISRLSIAFLLPTVLLLPGVDAMFSATMARKALAEPLLLSVAGWSLSRLSRSRQIALIAPSAVVAATLLILFWMIPRSIDLTQIYFGANALYVISFLIAGFLVSSRLPLLSSVARTVYAIYLSSMFVALGLLYASQSTLLCSAFTLADQHAFGWALASAGLVAYFVVLALVTIWLHPPSGNIALVRMEGMNPRS
jgi:hypothetical protein